MGSSSHETPVAANEEVEALRRQLVALQRVSSLGVLAGGVCHELNNALTPILNYAKLGLRNPDPAYREPAYQVIGRWLKGVHPVSTGVVVSALARPEWLVEIDVTAVKAG